MAECRFPFSKYPLVTLAHGAGGRFTQQLIDDIFGAALPHAQVRHDGAIVELTDRSGTVVMSTDSYVVKPLFFPGGDIARLAVTGTCNDLAMCGAQPKALSCGWIIEEGFSTQKLYDLAVSMAATAVEVGVDVVTGDTKVVEKQHGDGVYLNVTGIGMPRFASHPDRIRAGAAVLLSGDVGRHGCAILTQREDLQLQEPILSDCAHLWPQVQRLQALAANVHCLRDLTRGGLATALAELSEASATAIVIDRERVPVSNPVASVCELFGLDPLYVANEGRMVVICDEGAEAKVRAALGVDAVCIGRVESGRGVVANSAFGGSQVLDRLSGEQLPRIC